MKPRHWLLLSLVILLGFFLRCEALGSKAYGNDEATTSLRVAGATLEEYQHLFNGKPWTVAQLRIYQERLPGSSLQDVHHSLASEDPQHPPMYYDLERLWTGFDKGVEGHRRLSILFGTVGIPAFGWLVFEISGFMSAGFVGMALIAVSPFFVLYSQQAREYALWALLTVLASALLMRLLRTSGISALAWLGYALLLACSILTDILSIGVVFVHLFVLLCNGYRAANRRGLAAVFGAVALGAVLWLPAILGNRTAVTNNTFLAMALPMKVFLAKWLVNISVLLVDFGLLPTGYASKGILILGMLSAAAGLAGILWAGWWAARQYSGKPAGLLFGLIIVPAMLLILPDVLRHEGRSTAARYLVPTWLGLEALLAVGIDALARRSRSVGMSVLALALGAGVYSAFLRAPVPAWWTDWSAYGVVAQATAIERLPENAQIAYVQEGTGWDFSVMELANRLPENRVFRLYPTLADFVRANHVPVYLLDPAPEIIERLQVQGYKVRSISLGATKMGPALLKKNGSPKGDDGSLSIALWQVDRKVRNI